MPVTQAEWDAAEKLFAQPGRIKLSRKDKNLPGGSRIQHSFFKIGDEIYVKGVHEYIGQGGMGKVSVVENRQGERFALKVEGDVELTTREAEIAALTAIGLAKGTMQRTLYAPKEWLQKRIIKQKNYTLLKLLEGKDLLDHLYRTYISVDAAGKAHKSIEKNVYTDSTGKVHTENRKTDLEETTRLIFAIKACQQIQRLHLLGFLHCDIKPQNFMSTRNGNMITVSAIDLGFSLKIDEAEKFTKYRGTKRYMAPELMDDNTRRYSVASDVFALGVMLRADLGIKGDVIDQMCDANPARRSSIDDVIDQLYRRLAKRPDLDRHAKDVFVENAVFENNRDVFGNDHEASHSFVQILRDLESMAYVLQVSAQHAKLPTEVQKNINDLIKTMQAVKGIKRQDVSGIKDVDRLAVDQDVDQEEKQEEKSITLTSESLQKLAVELDKLTGYVQSILDTKEVSKNKALKNNLQKLSSNIVKNTNALGTPHKLKLLKEPDQRYAITKFFHAIGNLFGMLMPSIASKPVPRASAIAQSFKEKKDQASVAPQKAESVKVQAKDRSSKGYPSGGAPPSL